ncbi:MAG: ATP-binding cassette domain-containing protein, partial [Cyanobacteriota bacterium]
MSELPVVAIKNINHSWGHGALRKQVLFNINMEIHSGEIVIMKGPSGSGKTTLLTLLGGLRSVQSGSLKVFEQELCGASKSKLMHVRRHIGYIFQSHNLLQFLTSRQNVGMAVELNNEISQREVRTRSIAMLNAVGLGDRVDYYPE